MHVAREIPQPGGVQQYVGWWWGVSMLKVCTPGHQVVWDHGRGLQKCC